ncbi:MAG TPA: acyl-CoA synthetase [Microbacterium sp.]|nr:acyl-CoA synthetase [Microbacterium sp.]
MPTASAAPARFAAHHVQLLRAAFAAIAAVMITFSPDHSAAVGLSVFSGFAIATGLVWALAAWLVHPAGSRWLPITMAALNIVAGMAGGIVTLRSTALFFVVVIAWALATGLVEAIAGWRSLRRIRALGAAATEDDAAAPADARPDAARAARDGLTVGVFGVLLGIGLLLVPGGYVLDYYIPDAGQTFTLTGIAIAVGVFGAYAAIVAVYLAIAGFSPRRDASLAADPSAATSAPRPGEGA